MASRLWLNWPCGIAEEVHEVVNLHNDDYRGGVRKGFAFFFTGHTISSGSVFSANKLDICHSSWSFQGHRNARSLQFINDVSRRHFALILWRDATFLDWLLLLAFLVSPNFWTHVYRPGRPHAFL